VCRDECGTETQPKGAYRDVDVGGNSLSVARPSPSLAEAACATIISSVTAPTSVGMRSMSCKYSSQFGAPVLLPTPVSWVVLASQAERATHLYYPHDLLLWQQRSVADVHCEDSSSVIKALSASFKQCHDASSKRKQVQPTRSSKPRRNGAHGVRAQREAYCSSWAKRSLSTVRSPSCHS
jgi:hypothetical protein